jgi:hypothetical protein
MFCKHNFFAETFVDSCLEVDDEKFIPGVIFYDSQNYYGLHVCVCSRLTRRITVIVFILHYTETTFLQNGIIDCLIRCGSCQFFQNFLIQLL